MLLVVPQRRDGIELLKKDAAQLNLPRLVQNLHEREIHLKLPRFSIDYSAQLIDVLRQVPTTTPKKNPSFKLLSVLKLD